MLHRVELAGRPDGSRAVRLRHAAGACGGLFRDGVTPEALLAVGEGATPFDALARALHRRGVGSLLLEGGCDAAGVRAGLAFLGQRGATRVVLAAVGAACRPALAAALDVGLAGVVLLDPPEDPLGDHAPAAPTLVAASPERSLLARRVAAHLPRAEVVVVRDDGDRVAALLTFVLDAGTGSPAALEG